MNGTTRCPHCETRFKITEAQFTAHQGMVRCGHCMQSFDSRPTFIPDLPVPQPELLSSKGHPDDVRGAEQAEPGEVSDVIALEETVAGAGEMPEGSPVNAIDETSAIQSAGSHSQLTANDSLANLPTQSASGDALDISHLAASHIAAESHDVIPAMASQAMMAEHVAHDDFTGGVTLPSKRRTWPWVVGASASVLLLMAQSAYFFRMGLAAHLPVIKPALVAYCHLLNCTLPLPQNAESISIESSGLEADPEHENQITFSALLRNRAGYAMAFPALALTLNDNQDKSLARRFFMPAEYLPADENVQTGFLSNHEVSVKLRLNTGGLRPAGYRLELFYSLNRQLP